MQQQCKKCGQHYEFYKMSGRTCEHCLARDAYQAEKWSWRSELLGRFLFLCFVLWVLYEIFFR